MFIALLKLLVLLLLLLLPALLAARQLGMARALGVFAASLIITGIAGLLTPFWESMIVQSGLVLVLLVLSAWIFLAPDSWSSLVDFLMASALFSGVFVVLLSTAVPFGNLEWGVRFVSHMGLVDIHKPMETQQVRGNEDWREYHVTSDKLREQDPELFWRSRAGEFPFSAQGFKTSIEMEVPKPENVFRIMSYGDSNTEGPTDGDWSAILNTLLQTRNSPARVYEVINAGVAGYSSYQGARRFLQEWEKYEPDLVFVSFGWNDLPGAVDQPDKAYKPSSPILVKPLRFLVKYESYLALQHYVLSRRSPRKLQVKESRVPLPDYLENMASFAEIGRAKDIEIVFLTRPYRATTQEILKKPGWRSRVPSYNDALRQFAQDRGEQLFDVQMYFENETSGLFSDETHFDPQGLDEMAQFLVRELDARRLLQEP